MAIIVVMGVSGSGKTTVGKMLAARLGCRFFDGDDFHPPENIEKMANGIPLTDADRIPWLARLQTLLHRHLADGVVLACSALKRQYRAQLRENNPGLQFVYLAGDFETIWARMQTRKNHYMKAEMLQSQFAALEPPGPDEAFQVGGVQNAAQIVDQIVAFLGSGENVPNHSGHLSA
ncbi:MAG TPA: gluconokinase [Anaerolineales bacterium]|nr:gluconokinase [Anaerolineales bacterium]